MAVEQELLEILICPETKQSLALAPPELLQKLNERIRTGALRNRGGEAIEKPLEEALLREDGRVLYPVDDGIPVMLIEESIQIS